MSETPTDRIRNQEKAKDLYSRIREEHTREMLETGKRFMLIHPSGIPIGLVTKEEAIEAFEQVEEHDKSMLDKVKAHDYLNDEKVTGREFLIKYRK